MDQVKIDIVDPETLKGRIETLLNALVMGIRQLARYLNTDTIRKQL